MLQKNAILLVVVLVTSAGLGACRKKPEAAPVPTTVAVSDGASQRHADSLAADAARRRADSLANARGGSTDADAQRVQTVLKQALTQRIYFDYDKDVLRDDARTVLDAKASILDANPAVTLVITGHTDEQGTAEYNLALGQRRAAQVKRYLVSKGVQEGRLSVQSLGDSQPLASGTDAASYEQNRRAEFEPLNAPGALMRPRA